MIQQSGKLALALAAFCLSGSSIAGAATLLVNNNSGVDDGSSPFATISAAVAAANATDTIEVQETGTAYDEQVLVDESVTIIGTGTDKPVVTFTAAGGATYSTNQSSTQKPVVAIAADNVTIENLEIRVTHESSDSTRRSGIVAQDSTVGPFDGLVVDGVDFYMDGLGGTVKSTWEHIGIYASNATGAAEQVTIRNSTFNPGNTVPIADAGGTDQGLQTYFGKALRFYAVKVDLRDSEVAGWFRDIHFVFMQDTYVQNNIFHNSIETNSPANGQVRILDNTFLADYHYIHLYDGVSAPVDGTLINGDDQPNAIGFDPDYLGLFNKDDLNAANDPDYSGPIPTIVPGYQDEIILLKNANSNSGPRTIIDRNTFFTRRIGINAARSTNVTIKRNLFLADTASDGALPSPNPFGIQYYTRRHINIDDSWVQTCCDNTTLDEIQIEVVANKFEGDAVGVNVTNEIPNTGEPGAASGSPEDGTNPAGDDFSTEFTVAGNDFDEETDAFVNDYDSEPQPFDVSDNYFGEGGPDANDNVNNTGDPTGDVTLTNPDTSTNLIDSDGDTLYDGEETALYLTNPNVADSDGDGIDDGIEVVQGTDPNDINDPATPPTDADGDGIPAGIDPDDTPGSSPDANGDGIKDSYAYAVTADVAGAVTLGDVNGDGTRDNVDAIQIIEVFLQLQTLTRTPNDYDINRDGSIDNVDAVILFNFAVGNILYIPFP